MCHRIQGFLVYPQRNLKLNRNDRENQLFLDLHGVATSHSTSKKTTFYHWHKKVHGSENKLKKVVLDMTNKQKYDQAFIDNFSIDESVLGDDLVYNTIQSWDSIGHMAMIAAIEETFDIMMEIDDIIDFSSYKKGFEILAKYGVEF